MLRIFMLCIAIMATLCGCATYRSDNQERIQALPYHYSQFDAKLGWEIKSTANSTAINGIITNSRYFMMDELEIWAWSLDDRGKEVYRSADFINSLKENESAQFAMTLPRIASGTKLQLLYRYIGHDGGGESGDATKWSQSFTSEVP